MSDPVPTGLIADRGIRRLVLRNTASNYVGKIVALGTWFFLTPFILQQLGATSYGLWTLLGSLVAYGSLLDLGIAGAVVKYVAEYRVRGEIEQMRALVATALCLYCGLGLLAIGLSLVLAPLVPVLFDVPEHQRALARWLVVLMGLGVGIAIPSATSGAVLKGLQRYDVSNLVSVCFTVCSAVATVIVLTLGGGIAGMVGVNIVLTLLAQIGSVWAIKRIAPELQFGLRGARRSLVRTVFAFSSSLFVINAANYLQTKTDELVIGAVLVISAITPYALARKLSELGEILTDQFLKVILPLASALHAEDDQLRLRELYCTGSRLTLVIFVPVASILILFAPAILTLWVGATYASSAHLVTILTLASLIGTSQWSASVILQGMARHRLLAVSALVSGIVNLLLSISLAKYWGVVGVALGTLLPTAIEGVGFILPYTLRVIGLTARQYFRTILLPALAPAVPLLVVLYGLRFLVAPTSLLALGGIAGLGLAVYLVGYYLLGASSAERQLVRQMAITMRKQG